MFTEKLPIQMKNRNNKSRTEYMRIISFFDKPHNLICGIETFRCEDFRKWYFVVLRRPFTHR